ncbi:MAG TPA: hypothetical protein VII76_06955 [Acidimicrobiales bacterium]
MDRLPSPGDDGIQLSEGASSNFDGITIVEATEDAFLQFGPGPRPEPLAFDGRPDIDSALVEALRFADRNGPTYWPRVPLGRGDIDIAMVEALRNASVPDPDVPRA